MVDGFRITVESQSTTEMSCGPEGDAFETKVREVLTGEITYRIQASRLTLMRGDKGLTLRDQGS